MNKIVNEMTFELKNHILPFWMNLIDREYGGFYGKVDKNYFILRDAPKSSIINSRILWAFSATFNKFKDKNYIYYANHAYFFMINNLLDRKYGGLYLFVDYSGKVIDTRKHINNLCYAIYALTEYFEATHKDEVINLAISFFELIESQKNHSGIYLEEFDRQWIKKTNEFLDRFGLNATITMNNQLHLLEAYAKLYSIWPKKELLNQLKILIENFETKIFSHQSNSFNEFFDSSWNSLVNLKIYGHDIEASWLLSNSLEILGIENENILQIIKKILNNIEKEAMDKNSIILELANGNYNKKRMWWVQTEAVIGFVNGYSLFKVESYLEDAIKIWEFIKIYFIDKNPKGEWYSCVSDDMHYIQEENIVDEWKGPYHSTRMCLEIITRLQRL